MKNFFSNLLALILLGISFIFNGYLLALYFGFIYSVIHMFFWHSTPNNYANELFLCYGFLVIILLLIIGISDFIPSLSRIITLSREPLLFELDKISPLLAEVCAELGNSIKFTPKIFISDGIAVEASSYGAKTIIVGAELLANYSDIEIKAVLMHEIAHLHHKEGTIVLAIFWTNLPLQVIMWLYHWYANISLKIFNGFQLNLFSIFALIILVMFLPIMLLGFIGKGFFKIIFMLISQMFEYNADEFTAKNGYREGLISFLHKQRVFEADNTLMSMLLATHPSVVKRIARLEKYKI